MLLAQSANFEILFTLIELLLSNLRQTVADFHQDSDVGFDAVRFYRGAVSKQVDMPQVLSFSMMKVDSDRLMVMLADVTLEANQEQETIARKLQHAAHVDTLTRMPNRKRSANQ